MSKRNHPQRGPVKPGLAAATTPRRVRLLESAAVAERTELREATSGRATGAPATTSDGMMLDLVIIEAGWNKAGTRYYPADVLARDIPTVFPVGTHQYWNHPTATESVERPERDLADLAAVIVETPYTADGGKTMRAKTLVGSAYHKPVRDFWKHIGVSVNADGAGVYGERDGRKGMIVESIEVGKSVDFVTKAGAGGRILSLLEAARAQAAQPVTLREARSWGSWLESRLHLAMTTYGDDAYGDGRLTREERITLSSAIGDALKAWTARVTAEAPQLFERDLWAQPETVEARESLRLAEATTEQTRTALDRAMRAAYVDDEQWAYIRDFDPDRGLVWFEVGDKTETGTWQQTYTVDGDGPAQTAELTGERVAVLAQTVYTPVKAADDAELTEADRGQTPATDVTDGTAPTAPNPPTEEDPVSGTQTGPAPGTAGTATAADTASTTNAAPAVTDVQVREAAEARVKAEQERDVALREAEASKAELQRFRAVEAARPVTAAKLAETDLPPAAQARVLTGVLARVPLTDAGALDEAALTALVEAEATAERTYLASLAEAGGAGRVTGVGNAATATGGTGVAPFAAPAPQPNTALIEAYRNRGLSEDAARRAAVGRPA